MKIILSFLMMLVISGAQAQSEKFTKAMQANLAMIDSSFKSPASLLSLANSFERIATAEKKEWLPYYYAAFLQVNHAFMLTDKSKVDAVADKAEFLISKADSLSPSNSEISCIRSMISSCRLIVDPMSRYMKYGKESSDHLNTAIQQDTTNPRPYFLQGQSLKYTPEQFGGGCKTALPVFEKANEKFIAFIAASPFHPSWGREINNDLINECKK